MKPVRRSTRFTNDTDGPFLLGRLKADLRQAGADEVAVTTVLTALSELLTNIKKYAGRGIVDHQITDTVRGRRCVRVTAADRGPGIKDIDQAMSDRFSTSGTLGLGLPGIRRMVDEFEIRSAVGEGTTVTFALSFPARREDRR